MRATGRTEEAIAAYSEALAREYSLAEIPAELDPVVTLSYNSATLPEFQGTDVMVQVFVGVFRHCLENGRQVILTVCKPVLFPHFRKMGFRQFADAQVSGATVDVVRAGPHDVRRALAVPGHVEGVLLHRLRRALADELETTTTTAPQPQETTPATTVAPAPRVETTSTVPPAPRWHDRDDIDAHDPHRIVSVLVVVRTSPPEEIDGLLGPPRRPGIAEQATRVGIGAATTAAFLAYVAVRGREATARGLTGALGEQADSGWVRAATAP